MAFPGKGFIDQYLSHYGQQLNFSLSSFLGLSRNLSLAHGQVGAQM